MSREISESDWKHFRRVREVALERFCSRVLEEVAAIATASGAGSHQRYLELFRLLERRDGQLAAAFNQPRRSAAARQIAAIRAGHLFTDEEFAGFSPELRRSAESMAAILND